ncbi:MAG: MutS-related protein, partial [Polyangiaceae bacterium]
MGEMSASPTMRADFEGVYLALVRLFGLLCTARQPAPRVRRIEILRAVRDAFDRLADRFNGASSALSRLHDFGATITSGDGYRRLVALLDHEDGRVSLDLRLRVGADGEVRSMDIVGLRENRENIFYASVLHRLIVRWVLM